MDGHQILRLGRAVTSYYSQAEAEPANGEALEEYMKQNLLPEDYSYWQCLGNKQSQSLLRPLPGGH